MADDLSGINKQIQIIDKNVEGIILSAADLTINQDKFNYDLSSFIKLLTLARKVHEDEKSQWDALAKALSGESETGKKNEN